MAIVKERHLWADETRPADVTPKAGDMPATTSPAVPSGGKSART
ncbi:MAG: hypothetical protein O2782_20285 [bacterium]|nr:hypothetical protein [bacterium]